MKQVIKATNEYPEQYYIDGEYQFSVGGDEGRALYDWTQCSDILSDGDVLEFTELGPCREELNTYRVYMHHAYPVQIAGPRLPLLHLFAQREWITDEIREVAPDNLIDLCDSYYLCWPPENGIKVRSNDD